MAKYEAKMPFKEREVAYPFDCTI